MISQVHEQFPIDASGPIEDVDNLRNHLVHAAAVELSTVPLYLYSAYSIKSSQATQAHGALSAYGSVRAVVVEEMLHLCLVRNILTGVGGGDLLRLYDPAVMPQYPGLMLHRTPDLCLDLAPCSKQQMNDVFLPLELPAKHPAPPQPDSYNTLGQFYAAIEQGIEYLDAKGGLWDDARPDVQYVRGYWNNDGGGEEFKVVDLESAKKALLTIVEQGEGADSPFVPIEPDDPSAYPGQVELSHYARFKAIADGDEAIGEVWPVPTNPKVEHYEGHVKELATLFNAAYCFVLCMIDELYVTPTGEFVANQPNARYGLERTFISAMGGLLYPIASLLVRTSQAFDLNAAPTFEYHAFEDESPRDELARRCDALMGAFPELGGDDGVRRLIGLLPDVRPLAARA